MYSFNIFDNFAKAIKSILEDLRLNNYNRNIKVNISKVRKY
jgi:hypothetical protein